MSKTKSNLRIGLLALAAVALVGFSNFGHAIAQGEVPTNTFTATATATNTATEFPSQTPTETETVVPSDTPTSTETSGPKETPTNTVTEVVAPSETPTSTGSATPTPTATPTAPDLPQKTPSELNTVDLATVLTPKDGEIIEGAYIVVYKSNISVASRAASISSQVRSLGGEITQIYSSPGFQGYAANLPDRALEVVRQDPSVDFIVVDTIVTLVDDDISVEATQNNPVWGLDRIDQRSLPLNSKYTYSTTATNVHVYIVDTGIRPTHNEFGNRADRAFDAADPFNPNPTTNDCHGHGTHVAGTIGGSTYGVAKGAKLHAVRVFGCSSSTPTSNIIAGINWVTNNHRSPSVANLSVGGSSNAALDAALNAMINSGVVAVVAAGNDNTNACNYSPARVPNAITVGATTSTDTRSSFSNYGSCLDIFAPGSSIKSAYYTSNSATTIMNGTSMASPHVAGAAALYLSTNSGASPSQVASALISASTKNKINSVGSGSPNRMLYSVFSQGGSKTPTTVAPKGKSYDRTPKFTWTKVAGATRYQIQVYQGAKRIRNWVRSASAGCGPTRCNYTSGSNLPYASLRWRVRAFVNGKWQPFSAWRSFTVSKSAGFNSNFTNNRAGWSLVDGKWALANGSLRTGGLANKFASIAYKKSYTTLTYSVRVKRTGESNYANAIWFRGVPDPGSSENNWKKGYYFAYTNNGSYSIWYSTSGTYEIIKTWTYSSAINKDGWNTLKITANGNYLQFYINNTKVHSGHYNYLSIGRVGVGYYRDSTPGTLLVDWARLTTNAPSSALNEGSGPLNQLDEFKGESPFEFIPPED